MNSNATASAALASTTDATSRVNAARQALEQGLAALETSEDWTSLLRSMARVGRYSVARLSFNNQMLVRLQHPTAHVATFQSWLAAGRYVRRGEKSLAILQPKPWKRAGTTTDATTGEQVPCESRGVTFRTLPVFAIEQTEGEPLPEPVVPDVAGPEAFARSVEALTAVVLALGPETVRGVRFVEDAPLPGVNGCYNRRTLELTVVTGGRTRAQQFRTLVHETAHALLHGRGEDHHSRPEKEVEAESVAFVVCHALGVDAGSYSFPYVASWAGGAGSKAVAAVAASGERITRTAQRILAALCPDADGSFDIQS